MVLGAGTIGVLMSVPGQTVGVSVFTDFLIDSLGLPRQFLSLAYMVGTSGSALLLTKAGKLYDRFGPRIMAIIVSFLLGLVLVYLSFSADISAGLSSSFPSFGRYVIPFIVMCVGFFFLRFFGQGTLTLISRNMIMQWFEKRRGMANAILGVSISFGFSYSPRIFDAFIEMVGWQNAWRIIALIVGVGFALLAGLIYRNKPEDHGLIPDGKLVTSSKKDHPEIHAVRDFTLSEARRTLVFWIFTAGIFAGSLIGTAFTFHIVSIFETSGLLRDQAVAVFFPASMVAVAFQFLGSWSSDYIKLKYLLMVQVLGLIILSIGMVLLGSGGPVVLIIFGLGMNQGMFGVNGNLTWPRFFGRKHLGAVSGFATAFGVAASAVGPYLFSLSLDLTGSYRGAAVVALVCCCVIFVGSLMAERPK